MALVVLALPLLVSAYRNKDLIPEHPIIEVVTDSQSAKATAAQKPAARAPQAQGLAKRPIALMAVVIALEWSLVFWTALFLIDVAGISAAQGAVATAVLLTGVLAGRLAGSFLLERLGGWRLLVLSCALALIAVVLVLQAASMTSALLAAAVAGLSAGNMYPASVALVLQENPHAKDRSLAQASLFATLATVLWPVFLGQVADRIGLANAILMLFALLLAAAVMLVWARPRSGNLESVS